MDDLKPCPFCGSVNTMLIAALGDRPGCDDCYATTETVDAWNRRVPAAVPREPTEEMVAAGRAAYGESVCANIGNLTGWANTAKRVYQAMHDAAQEAK